MDPTFATANAFDSVEVNTVSAAKTQALACVTGAVSPPF
jgi:hypothetical protein